MEKTEKPTRLKEMLVQIAPRNQIEAVSRPSSQATEHGGFEKLGAEHRRSDRVGPAKTSRGPFPGNHAQ